VTAQTNAAILFLLERALKEAKEHITFVHDAMPKSISAHLYNFSIDLIVAAAVISMWLLRPLRYVWDRVMRHQVRKTVDDIMRCNHSHDLFQSPTTQIQDTLRGFVKIGVSMAITAIHSLASICILSIECIVPQLPLSEQGVQLSDTFTTYMHRATSKRALSCAFRSIHGHGVAAARVAIDALQLLIAAFIWMVAEAVNLLPGIERAVRRTNVRIRRTLAAPVREQQSECGKSMDDANTSTNPFILPLWPFQETIYESIAAAGPVIATTLERLRSALNDAIPYVNHALELLLEGADLAIAAMPSAVRRHCLRLHRICPNDRCWGLID